MTKRKFREVVGSGIEGSFWKPNQIGESIEGEIKEFKEGDYGLQAVLILENGNEVELPAHRDLQCKVEKLYEEDYIRVTLTGFKKASNPEYNDKPLYKVEIAED